MAELAAQMAFVGRWWRPVAVGAAIALEFTVERAPVAATTHGDLADAQAHLHHAAQLTSLVKAEVAVSRSHGDPGHSRCRTWLADLRSTPSRRDISARVRRVGQSWTRMRASPTRVGARTWRRRASSARRCGGSSSAFGTSAASTAATRRCGTTCGRAADAEGGVRTAGASAGPRAGRLRRSLGGVKRKVRRLLSHHVIEDRYRRPGKGNDKGSVEGIVGWSRRTFMVPLPRSQPGTTSMAGWRNNAASGRRISCAVTARRSAFGFSGISRR